MREIVINKWCDLHPDGTRAEATAERGVTFDSGPAYIVDLCADCERSIFRPMVEIVMTNCARADSLANDPADGKAAAPTMNTTPFPCLLCRRTFATGGKFAYHVRNEHGITPGELYGENCPLCGAECVNQQGLAMHGQHSHEQPRVSVLFDYARLHGDPVGIVAARVAMAARNGNSSE